MSYLEHRHGLAPNPNNPATQNQDWVDNIDVVCSRPENEKEESSDTRQYPNMEYTKPRHKRCRYIEEPPLLVLPPAATTAPPFTGSLQACAIAAEGLTTIKGYQLQDDVQYPPTAEEYERNLGDYIHSLRQIEPLDRTSKEEGMIKDWNKYQIAKRQLNLATENRKTQQDAFKQLIIQHQEINRRRTAQKTKFKSALSRQKLLQLEVDQLQLTLGFHPSSSQDCREP
jgi:hypothetical protein